MPGTVIVREHVVREMMIDVMLGLWNDGFRKQLIINNHGTVDARIRNTGIYETLPVARHLPGDRLASRCA